MTQSLSFQDIILRLLGYWKDQGCLVQQPYNVQVGAGTMNPATVLRVLGPEPWNVVYVEPSIRPDDGRFGDNPNRLQMHHQLQVILQPDPGDPQERYLASLEALGIDLRRHDVRFVEDNWESPALGAWGLGWEVWLDGQEITQFTYFQQAGGQTLDPVAVEITYGLDRIALALQGADSVWQMRYSDDIRYGDILLAQRERALPLLLRGRRCRSTQGRLRYLRARGQTVPGSRVGHTGARLQPQMLPPVQRAGHARCHWRDGTGELFPAHAQRGAGNFDPLRGATRAELEPPTAGVHLF